MDAGSAAPDDAAAGSAATDNAVGSAATGSAAAGVAPGVSGPPRAATPLTAIRAHALFCGAPEPGCKRTCLASPGWSSATPTFTHAQLWAYEDHCPHDALQEARCTLALERGGVWYQAFDTV
ncbi:MAG TPA: hypothetical protein VGM39_22805, partial [Kofleriaceae bacterium]